MSREGPLRDRIGYVEHHSGALIVNCKMYRARHIFEADDGNLYVEQSVAGISKFTSLDEALDAINKHPDKYAIAAGVKKQG